MNILSDPAHGTASTDARDGKLAWHAPRLEEIDASAAQGAVAAGNDGITMSN